MAITKDTLKSFRTDFATAVAQLEKKYGIKLDIGSISFDASSFSCRLTGETTGKAGSDWARFADGYGLKADDYGKTFSYKGRTYKLVGLKIGNKYCITTERDDGQEFNFTAEAVRQAMGR